MEKSKYLARLDEFRDAQEEFKQVINMKGVSHRETISTVKTFMVSHHSNPQAQDPLHHLKPDSSSARTLELQKQVRCQIREGTPLEEIEDQVSKNELIVKRICSQAPSYDYQIKDSDLLGFLMEKPKKKLLSASIMPNRESTRQEHTLRTPRSEKGYRMLREGEARSHTPSSQHSLRPKAEPKFFGPEYLTKTRPKFWTGQKMFRTNKEAHRLHKSIDDPIMLDTDTSDGPKAHPPYLDRLRTSRSFDNSGNTEAGWPKLNSTRSSRKPSLTLDQLTTITYAEAFNPYHTLQGKEPLLQTGVSFAISDLENSFKNPFKKTKESNNAQRTTVRTLFGLAPSQVPKCVTIGHTESKHTQEADGQVKKPAIRLLVRRYHNKQLRNQLNSIENNS